MLSSCLHPCPAGQAGQVHDAVAGSAGVHCQPRVEDGGDGEDGQGDEEE